MSAKETYAAAKAAPRQVATDHPNATTSGTFGALAVVLIWISDTLLGVPMDAQTGAALAVLISTGALFVGRRAPWFRTSESQPAIMDGDPDNPP